MKRRTFLKGMASTSLSLGALPLIASNSRFFTRKSLNILVLGGTSFVGPAIVNAALEEQHSVTLFNRGITDPDLFPQLPLIKGDRERGMNAYQELKNQRWDVVIDVWPEKSRLVDEATHALQKNADHYLFISSIAVYRDFQEVGLNEQSFIIEPGIDKEAWGYGEEKAESERLVRQRFPDKHTILRPGPIKGWKDPALDLVYWLAKLQRNHDILAPGTGKDPLQFIDVKDVGRFAIYAAEHQIPGIFNTTGPRKKPLLWEEFLKSAKKQLKSKSKLYWPTETFLRENQVYSFEDLPLWAPLSEDQGFMQISMEKAIASSFQFRPIRKTIEDCLSWFKKIHPKDYSFGTNNGSVGLNREREQQLLKNWENIK